MPISSQKQPSAWASKGKTEPQLGATIMPSTSNLTRTRSLRIPTKSRDSNGQTSSPSNGSATSSNSSLTRSGSMRWSRPSSIGIVKDSLCDGNSIRNSPAIGTKAKSPMNPLIAFKEALLKAKMSGKKSACDQNVSKSFASNGMPSSTCSSPLPNIRVENAGEDLMTASSYSADRVLVDCCPASPVSVSSIDSGIIGNNASLNQTYANLRRLTEEHERLQNEYAKLRQQCMELAATQSAKDAPHSSSQLMCQNTDCQATHEVASLAKLADGYKTQSLRLQEELRRLKMGNKCWESNGQEMGSKLSEDNERLTNGENLFDSLNGKQENNLLNAKVEKLEATLREMEADNKEAKENIEFLTSERLILAESLKEAEDMLEKEKADRKKEKHSLEALAVNSKKLYDKVVAKNDQIKGLETAVAAKGCEVSNMKDISREMSSAIDRLATVLSECWASLVAATGSKGEDNQTLKATSLMGIEEAATEMKAFLGSVLRDNAKEINDLKSEISLLVAENLALKSNVKRLDLISREKEAMSLQIQEQTEKINGLIEDNEDWIEKHRCAEVLNVELRKQLKEVSSKEFGGCLLNNPLVLRQELTQCKESLAVKEEMLQKLASKYARNRQVWEENEMRANEEIQKLDEVIDRVITGLKNNSQLIADCPPLRELLNHLTNEVSPGGHVKKSTAV